MKFIRQDGHKKVKLGTKWRKPKGYQSKMRLQKKGYHAVVKVGYGRKTEDKGKDKTGKVSVVISTSSDLKNINSKIQNVLISSTVGKRKKLEIFEEANKLNIDLANVSEKMIEKIQKELVERKLTKTKQLKKKETKIKKEKNKEIKKENLKQETEDTTKKEKIEDSIEENKKQKREQEKVLIKKQ